MREIYKGTTKQGQALVLRYPTMQDVQIMRDYINSISRERTYISFQGEQLTMHEEREFVVHKTKQIRKKTAVQLLAFVDGQLAGISGIEMQGFAMSHVGGFGISVAKEFRGVGIGQILMEQVLEQAKKNIPQLKIVTLEVFENNDIAVTLYKKMGFNKFGNLPRGVKHKGRYVGHVYMYKEIRKR